MDPIDQLSWQGAAAIAAAVRRGDCSAREVVEAHIARIQSADAALNAVAFERFEQARAEADAADRVPADGRGPLHGVPVTVKDQALVAGTPTTLGLPSRAGHRAERDGPLVARLRDAGAIVVAKTNVPQLLLAHETTNPLHGTTRNPWDHERAPGGSSGGEAALIAAGASPLGLGADLGGSLRIPAHVTGITTIKPTAHRMTLWDNLAALESGQEAIVAVMGPMARNVTDVTLGLRVLSGADHVAVGADAAGRGAPPDPAASPLPWRDPLAIDVASLTVGVYTHDGVFAPSPACTRAVNHAAGVLEQAGARVVTWSPLDPVAAFERYLGLLGADGYADARRLVGDEPTTAMLTRLLAAGRLPAGVARRAAGLLGAVGQATLADVVRGGGRLRSVDAYWMALRERARFQRAFATALHQHDVDVLLCPPYGLPAIPHGSGFDLVAAGSHAFLFNLLGMPAGVVPVTRVQPGEDTPRRAGIDVVQRAAARAERGSAGLPIGVQVAGRWWREDVVLAVMAAIERGGGQPITGPLPTPTGSDASGG